MAVYKRNYTAYTGTVTPVWTRVLVLARYAFEEAWSSKITVGLFIFCLLPCILSLLVIYLADNPMARALIGGRGPETLAIDAKFFLKVLATQSWLALVLASWIAPRMITLDLADNALPILLSHPISRFGYVFGKFIALFGSLSLVTWLPCLLLFVFQGYFEFSTLGNEQSSNRVWLAGGIGDLDCLSLAPWPRTVFLGEVEGDGDGRHLCRGLCAGWHRSHRKRGAAHKVGTATERTGHDVEPVAKTARRSGALR
jgi:hypothetical protein